MWRETIATNCDEGKHTFLVNSDTTVSVMISSSRAATIILVLKRPEDMVEAVKRSIFRLDDPLFSVSVLSLSLSQVQSVYSSPKCYTSVTPRSCNGIAAGYQFWKQSGHFNRNLRCIRQSLGEFLRGSLIIGEILLALIQAEISVPIHLKGVFVRRCFIVLFS